MTSTVSRPAEATSTPKALAPVGSDSRAARVVAAPTTAALREPNSRSAIRSTTPICGAPDGVQLAAHQVGTEAHHMGVGSDLQGRDRAAKVVSIPNTGSLLDPALSLAADFLDDIERVKLANENRLRALTRVGTDTDGVDRYIGLDADHPVVAQLAKMVEALASVEHDAVLSLQRMVRKHPLGAWIKAQRGIGEKQGARLLASIGDPYWRPEIVREDGTVIPEGPRTVSALWAYCGLHVLPAAGQDSPDAHEQVASGGDSSTGGDSSQRERDTHQAAAGVAARRRKGQQANWSTKAKTRAYLIAERCMVQYDKATCPLGDDKAAVHAANCSCSPYRLEYDRRKAHTSVSRPEWTDGHRHADALRVASKAILRDLWRAGRDWHLAQKESS